MKRSSVGVFRRQNSSFLRLHMSALVPFVTVVHIILCVFIVLVVLVQQGKGAEISASFGGSSQTVFGSSGGANFFTTFTGVCAALFFMTSIFLATQGSSHNLSKSVMDVAVPASNTAPAKGAQNTSGAATGMATGNTTTPAGVPAQTAAEAQAAHPTAPDAATQNALSPATAQENGAEAAPRSGKAAPVKAAPAQH
jgi:preprotein translocase subunit SecG